jgi:hypothetical protein
MRRLTPAQRAQFDAASRRMVDALCKRPPKFEPALRVKRVQGEPGVWEMTWAADGRAIFSCGAEIRPGDPHVIWRRVGDHSILGDP